MIYMIEIDYSDPASEAEWNEWYDGYIRALVTVPGIRTAQRFRGEARPAAKYLAAYSVSDPRAYVSEPYRAIGGGGTASRKWSANIKRRRCLFEGIDWLPEVREGSALVATETPPDAFDLPSLVFSSLAIVDLTERGMGRDFGVLPFDLEPTRRFLAVAGGVALGALRNTPDVAVYTPQGPRETKAKD